MFIQHMYKQSCDDIPVNLQHTHNKRKARTPSFCLIMRLGHWGLESMTQNIKLLLHIWPDPSDLAGVTEGPFKGLCAMGMGSNRIRLKRGVEPRFSICSTRAEVDVVTKVKWIGPPSTGAMVTPHRHNIQGGNMLYAPTDGNSTGPANGLLVPCTYIHH